jgi:flagellar secretion chaperone FliS
MNNPLQHYQKMKADQAVSGADPHRLIVMLMQGVIEKVAAAKGYLQQGNRAEKAQQISWAISILDGLRMSLDKEKGGEIAGNLDDLYGYMEEQLLKANVNDDARILEEVSSLMKTVLSGWMEIAPTKPTADTDREVTAGCLQVGA